MNGIELDQHAEGPAVHFHLLGVVDYDRCQQVQRRLAYDAEYSARRRIAVLLCEHPPLITVGRGGSWGHIRLSAEQLQRRRLEVRWVSRGGGCILHTPGQLAVYPIVPIERCGWTRADFEARIVRGLNAALGELRIHARADERAGGIWGRSGLLAALGVECQQGVAWQGAFLNVNPRMDDYRFVDVSPGAAPGQRTMGALLSERGGAVRMTQVRAAVVEQLAAALESKHYFLHTGHPYLRPTPGATRESFSRAG